MSENSIQLTPYETELHLRHDGQHDVMERGGSIYTRRKGASAPRVAAERIGYLSSSYGKYTYGLLEAAAQIED